MAVKNGVPFRQVLVSPSKHSIKAPYAMNPKKITLHNTDNQMPAINEINYMNSNNNQVSYHVAIDEKEAIQGLPFNRNGWHSGDGGNGYGNRNTVAVEICRNYDRSRGTTNLNEPLKSQYSKAEQNTIKYVAQLCVDLGIVANNENIRTHNNWNGKWCPSKILNEGRLQQVKNGIIAEYNRLKGQKPNQNVVSSNKKDSELSFSQVVDKALSGGYGNYPNREKNINNLTNYTYAQVQSEINKRLGNKLTPKPTQKTAEQVAQEISKGQGNWGNNPDRARKLQANGYDARWVQNRVNQILKGQSKSPSKAPAKPKASLAVDGYVGPEVVKALQRYFDLVVDGEIWGQFSGNQATKAFNQRAVKYGKSGSPVVKALQRKIGATADGIWGAGTTRALQRYLGTPVDGIISRPSTAIRELQRRLNNGTF